MAPCTEPDVKPVAKSTSRWVVKVPTAPENRPIPPVMVLISTILLKVVVSVLVGLPCVLTGFFGGFAFYQGCVAALSVGHFILARILNGR